MHGNVACTVIFGQSSIIIVDSIAKLSHILIGSFGSVVTLIIYGYAIHDSKREWLKIKVNRKFARMNSYGYR